MTYATPTDLIARFGEKEALALADRAFAGVVDEAVLAEALEWATAEIDGYLSGRYALPLSPVPRILTGYACDIARYQLCGTGGVVVTEEIRTRYQDAIKFLRLAAEGKVSLGGMPSGESAPTTDNAVVFNAGSKVFGRDGGAY